MLEHGTIPIPGSTACTSQIFRFFKNPQKYIYGSYIEMGRRSFLLHICVIISNRCIMLKLKIQKCSCILLYAGYLHEAASKIHNFSDDRFSIIIQIRCWLGLQNFSKNIRDCCRKIFFSDFLILYVLLDSRRR